jgi:DUF4097 and DUF4098 domain-containing protein YvlB
MRRLLTLTFILLFTTAAFAETDVIRKGFNVSEGGTLRLDAGVGDITIVTGGTGVAFEVTRKARGRDAEETMREHRITFRQEGNDVIVETERDERGWNWFDWNDYDVQWNVRVPARYNVDVKTSGGSIELGDIGGRVDARTSGGSIRVGRVTGTADVRTSGGSIRIDGATGPVNAHTSGGSITVGDTNGPVDVRTSGGSISLARVNGDVIARTSGGGIRIDDAAGTVNATTSGGSINARLSRQPTGDSKLSTSGGGVTVQLAGGIAVELDARASGGGVHSDVPITIVGEMDDNELRGRINGGGPKLVLRTSGGGIRVKPLS